MKAPRTLEIRWSEDPSWSPYAPRIWRLRTPLLRIQRKTDSGVECFNLREGALVDFRSGGWGVDPVIPQVRNPTESIIWGLHDLGYYGFGPSREILDAWLRMDLLAAGYSPFIAGLAYHSVRIFGDGHYSEEPTKEFVDRMYWENLELIRHDVLDRFTLDVTCPSLKETKCST